MVDLGGLDTPRSVLRELPRLRKIVGVSVRMHRAHEFKRIVHRHGNHNTRTNAQSVGI